jgi:hypothetical protein
MSEDELEAAIAGYRTRLRAEGIAQAADLDEIEDHLRALVSDLRASGMTPEAACRQAIARLGDPDALAREHALVRPSFGARLSKARAWSAAALLAIPALVALRDAALDPAAMIRLSGALLLCALVTIIALATRSASARAIGLGYAAFCLPNSIFFATVWPTSPATPLLPVAVGAGLVVLLGPWRGGELSLAGWALVLVAFACPVVTQLHAQAGYLPVFTPTVPTIALVAFAAGALGAFLRLRWAAAPLAVAAAAVLQMTVGLGRFDLDAHVVYQIAAASSTALALGVAARLCWISGATARPGGLTRRAVGARKPLG